MIKKYEKTNRQSITEEINSIKTRLSYLESQVNKKESSRYIKEGDKYYRPCLSTSLENIYNSDEVDVNLILNKQVYFTKEECELYNEVNHMLCIATMEEVDHTKKIFELMYNSRTNKVNTRGCISHLCFLSKYLSNDEASLQEAINAIGQTKLKGFFDLKPILPCECENFPKQKILNER